MKQTGHVLSDVGLPWKWNTMETVSNSGELRGNTFVPGMRSRSRSRRSRHILVGVGAGAGAGAAETVCSEPKPEPEPSKMGRLRLRKGIQLWQEKNSSKIKRNSRTKSLPKFVINY